jgi:hypothetical protein
MTKFELVEIVQEFKCPDQPNPLASIPKIPEL